MGIWDGSKALLFGKGKQTVPVTMQPNEQEVARVVAGYHQTGGDLVVTNQRVVFTPLETADVISVLTWVFGKVGAPGPIADLPGAVGKLITQQTSLGGITAVAAGSGGGFGGPPTILLTGNDGTTTEIGVLAGRVKPNGSTANVVTRDEIVTVIQRGLAGPTP